MRLKEILGLYRGGRYMSLSLKERRAVVKEVSKRYKKVKKKEKGMILDEFVKLTGYNRCYASYLLRSCEKKTVVYRRNGTGLYSLQITDTGEEKITGIKS